MVVIEARISPNYDDRENIFLKNIELLVFEEDDHEICFDLTFGDKTRKDDNITIIFNIADLLANIGKALINKE